MLDWAAAAIGPGARIAKVRALHRGQGPWQLRIEHCGGTTDAVLRAPTPPQINAAMVATAAAALEVAERHGLPAPRLIDADLTGAVTGVLTTLETVVPGTTDWPPPPSSDRLRAAGAALARVHAVAMEPREHLPFRPRPIAVDDFAADRRNARMPTTPLLEKADELITSHGLPPGGPFSSMATSGPATSSGAATRSRRSSTGRPPASARQAWTLANSASKSRSRSARRHPAMCSTAGNARPARRPVMPRIGTPLLHSTLVRTWTEQRLIAVTRSCARRSRTSGGEGTTIPVLEVPSPLPAIWDRERPRIGDMLFCDVLAPGDQGPTPCRQ